MTGELSLKEFLARLLRNWPVVALGWGGSDRLAREVVRLHAEGRIGTARDAAMRLVERQRERLGVRDPDYATALSNLGLLLRQEGDLDASEPFLCEALDIRREVLGERHPDYAASLTHLGDLLQLRGDLAGAEPLFRRALSIFKEALGEDHPDYATGLTGLAQLLHRRGDLAGAEPLLRQALVVRRDALGERHPMYATALSNVGLVLHRRGDLAGAEPLLRQALVLRRDVLGGQHPDFAASLSHLAMILIERHEPASAELLLGQAIEIRGAALGARHPDVLADVHALAKVRRLLQAEGPRHLTHQVWAPPGPNGNNGVPSGAVAVEPAAHGRESHEIAAELRDLAADFGTVGGGLADAAVVMQTSGLPPPAALIDRISDCHRRFVRLRTEVIRRSQELLVDVDPESPLGLAELISLTDRAAQVEEEWLGRALIRDRALALIDRVLGARHSDPAEAPLLRPCLAAAEGLRDVLDAARISEPLPDEAAALADASHPLAALVRLTAADEFLSDHAWSELHGIVSAAFGKALASAASRSRIEVPPAAHGRRCHPPTAATPLDDGPIQVATGSISLGQQARNALRTGA